MPKHVNILTPEDIYSARIVSLYELQSKLLPLLGAVSWAKDAVMDLWSTGTPVPTTGRDPFGNPVERRFLLPRQFDAWTKEVSKRLGENIVSVTLDEG
jgi:hypothetical protein